jgi:hypothetical protein
MRRLRLLPGLLLAGLALCLAACNGGVPGLNGATTPLPTAIPATPTPNPALVSNATGAITVPSPMPSISLGSYQAATVAAVRSGLVLAPPPPNSSTFGVASLAFVPFKGGTPTTFAHAATGTTINAFTTGGDWVAYVQADAQGGNWELWAVNPTTGTQHQVDSAVQEHGSGILPGDFATDGTDVVWAVSVAGQNSATLFAYNLASGTTRTLDNLPAATFVAVVLVNRLLYYQTVDTANKTTAWLWLLTQPTPTQITAQPKGGVALNSRYVAWYDADPCNLDLYDIVTGKTIQIGNNDCSNAIIAPCVAPIIAPDRPYMACLDDVDDQYQVIRVPAGTSATFGLHATGGFGAFANGRLYWIPEPNPLSSNTVVDYFNLPAS